MKTQEIVKIEVSKNQGYTYVDASYGKHKAKITISERCGYVQIVCCNPSNQAWGLSGFGGKTFSVIDHALAHYKSSHMIEMIKAVKEVV
jgi:hypothetical protein